MLTVTASSGFGGSAPRATAYRYFLLNITDNNGNGTYTHTAQFEIFVGAVEYPTANMTGATAPSPLVASANEDGSGPAYTAFDGSDTSPWISNQGATAWLKIDLGSGNEIIATSVKLANDNSDVNRMVKDFTIEGSNTGSFSGEEEILTTVTGETSWGSSEVREFTF